MPHKPPHLELDDDMEIEYVPVEPKPKFSAQGPSKYGKGGSRVAKARGRKGKR